MLRASKALLFLFLLGFASGIPARAEFQVPKLYFEDKTAAVSIDGLLARLDSFDWRPVRDRKPRFGPTKSRVWFRFSPPTLAGKLEVGERLILEVPNSMLNRLELYVVVHGQVRNVFVTGRDVPESGRSLNVLPVATNTFRLPTPPEPGTEYFLSAKSSFPLAVPIRLMGVSEFSLRHWTRMWLLGIFFGCLLTAAAFNGFLAVSLRSRFYWNYTLFVGSIAMAFLAHEGISSRIFWPESIWWIAREMFFFGSCAAFFYSRFVREFLESARVAPWLDRLLRVLEVVIVSSAAWLMVSFNQPVAIVCQSTVVVLNIAALAIATKAWKKGIWSSKYFFLSSLVLNLAVFLFQLQEAGLFWIGFFLEKAPHVGTVLEVVLLSLALADRIRRANREFALQSAALAHAEKLGALGRMAGEVAHEINNPLAIIHGNAVLIGQSESSPQVKEYAATIERTANRISKIVKGMRSMARDSREDICLPTPLYPLLQDVLALCQERADGAGVALEIPSIDKEVKVFCRSSEICQVLINLLSNAFDAVEATANPEIKLEIRERENVVEIAVLDNGCGIAPAIRPRIHEPFFTTKKAGDGLGLGLSISRMIVEAHGGKLFLDEAAANTKFVFTLPSA